MVSLFAFGAVNIIGLVLTFMAPALPTSCLTIYKMILGRAPAWGNFFKGVVILLGYVTVFTSLALMRFAKKER